MEVGKVRTKVTRELIESVIKERDSKIPGDSILIGMQYDPGYDSYDAVFISPSVPTVLEGSPVPDRERIEYDSQPEEEDDK